MKEEIEKRKEALEKAKDKLERRRLEAIRLASHAGDFGRLRQACDLAFCQRASCSRPKLSPANSTKGRSRRCAESIFPSTRASSLPLPDRADAVNRLCCNYSARWIDRPPELFSTAENRCRIIPIPQPTALARSDLFSRPFTSCRLSPRPRTCRFRCSKSIAQLPSDASALSNC